jgi:hypothetical protein
MKFVGNSGLINPSCRLGMHCQTTMTLMNKLLAKCLFELVIVRNTNILCYDSTMKWFTGFGFPFVCDATPLISQTTNARTATGYICKITCLWTWNFADWNRTKTGRYKRVIIYSGTTQLSVFHITEVQYSMTIILCCAIMNSVYSGDIQFIYMFASVISLYEQ